MSNDTDPKDEAMSSDTDDTTNEALNAETDAAKDNDEATATVKYDVVFDDDDNALDFADLATANADTGEVDAEDGNDGFADSPEDVGDDGQATASTPARSKTTHGNDSNAETVAGQAKAKNEASEAGTEETPGENGEDKALPDSAAEANAKRVNETLGLAVEEENELEAHEAKSPTIEPATVISSRLDRETITETDILLKPNPTFAFDHVTFTNRKTGRNVLDNIDWSFFAGSLYAITGADDEQRRALLALASGFYRPDSGQVMVKSQSLLEIETNEIRGHRIGLVTQRYSVRDDLDALTNITFTMRASGRTFLKPIPEAARDVLRSVDFDEATTGVLAGELKPVDQRRLAIARAICCEATVVIADDPIGGLDADDRDAILDLLSRLAHARDPKRCVIVVTPEDTNASGETDGNAETDYEAKADKIYSF
ncbi:ATP-binding cassette domain-containing protein [Bifidobacterium sp. ESL0775]|uniref:ATP-binding cassette domain-containing protein n=1 Tax=Bifidobacterium sp. ESL0775 TaxID=2983230 RepID=UPI0023F8E2A6|nr:ATP-binding cassette domain-containing protein [Bifidobacterium sp. ESL0775]WEV69262.1 ATP-binding cassette domain-containing protein [Bifidobacterium sp. ESL0775]